MKQQIKFPLHFTPENRQKALDLLNTGLSYRDVARTMGRDYVTANKNKRLKPSTISNLVQSYKYIKSKPDIKARVEVAKKAPEAQEMVQKDSVKSLDLEKKLATIEDIVTSNISKDLKKELLDKYL